jgi:hypothetical protein
VVQFRFAFYFACAEFGFECWLNVVDIDMSLVTSHTWTWATSRRSGLDVFCVTILAGVLEIRQFANFIVGDKCVQALVRSMRNMSTHTWTNGGFLKYGYPMVPLDHPFIDGFSFVNHPAIGHPHLLEPPICTLRRQWRLYPGWHWRSSREEPVGSPDARHCLGILWVNLGDLWWFEIFLDGSPGSSCKTPTSLASRCKAVLPPALTLTPL